ncbi:branched-chain amino acid ABC transporter permease [Archaeoglobus veneficus]|uniref:ABC-type transporter, integral membrane subunit n=1 Tax=Archaeoglobus veneficus (strain DSM 11195 / SNP6) TaxID=693661 RepID=F2KSX3_ARCVS|nr:branched-chain amino acid ABC transporter permease [Archaeoglobus veneficus]AEA47018.1 ABC-type transporter, integral membrane subunit [Archaeoglobus veneficus SNP6]
MILQSLINGITMGGIYALIALGFVLIYKASKVLNFAQGELVMAGAFICLALFDSGLPLWASVIIAVILSAFVGFIIEKAVLKPLIGEPILSVIMVTLGLAYMIRGLVLAIWGPDIRAFPQIFPPGSFEVFGVIIPYVYLGGLVLSLVAIAVFILFFTRTTIGIAMRAVADDQSAAMSLGISVEKIFAISWAISAMVAAIGGILVGNIYGGINVNFAFIGLKVFAVVILGGLDSIPGAIVGGIIIGVAEALGGTYLEPVVGGGFKDVFPLLLMLVIMAVKPYGLFGTERIERV